MLLARLVELKRDGNVEAKGEVVDALDGLPEVPGLREFGSDDEAPTFVDKGVRPRRRPGV